MAIKAPGNFFDTIGTDIIIINDVTATAVVTKSMLDRLLKYVPHFGMKAAGTFVNPIPKKSFIWVENIVSAIPAVKPTTIGYGMNLITVPRWKSPINTSIRPAMQVAKANPSRPKVSMMPYTIMIKAPVGPPIWTEQPPNADTRNPPIIAVMRPIVGLTPLAMANATANGSATMPTTMPAIKSDLNLDAE